MTDINDLKEFTNTKKGSKLLPYKRNIEYLLDNNATQVAIIEYLHKKENITVTRPTLSYFIKKHIKKTPFTPKDKSTKKENETNQNKPKKLKDSVFDN